MQHRTRVIRGPGHYLWQPGHRHPAPSGLGDVPVIRVAQGRQSRAPKRNNEPGREFGYYLRQEGPAGPKLDQARGPILRGPAAQGIDEGDLVVGNAGLTQGSTQ